MSLLQPDTAAGRSRSDAKRLQRLERRAPIRDLGNNSTLKYGLLDPLYRGPGAARVLIDGETSYSAPLNWIAPYEPASSRRVYVMRVGGAWVIAGQTQHETGAGGHRVFRLTLGPNVTTYNRYSADTPWSDGPIATQLPSGLVVLSGLLKFNTTVATGAVIATGIPVGLRPAKTKRHYCNQSDTAKRLSILADGSIVAGPSFTAAGYVSLDGVAYWPDGVGTWTTIGSGGSSWGANFEPFDTVNFEEPAFYVDPYGFTWFRGNARVKVATSGDNTSIIVLPAAARAQAEQHIRTTGQDAYAGVGAGVANGLNWKLNSPGAVGNYISLEGVMITTAAALANNPWQNIEGYANGWVQYSTGFPIPAYLRRGDGLATAKGMISTGTLGVGRAFAMERELWPVRGRALMDGIASNARSRLDVSGYGEVESGRVQGGVSLINGSNAWFSLDSQKWVTGA